MGGELAENTAQVLGQHSFPARSAQAVTTPIGKAWVVANGKAICIVQAGPGAVACGGASYAARHGLVLGFAEPVGRESGKRLSYGVLGLAPDWAKTAKLKAGPRFLAVRVRENAYGYRAGERIMLEGLLP